MIDNNYLTQSSDEYNFYIAKKDADNASYSWKLHQKYLYDVARQNIKESERIRRSLSSSVVEEWSDGTFKLVYNLPTNTNDCEQKIKCSRSLLSEQCQCSRIFYSHVNDVDRVLYTTWSNMSTIYIDISTITATLIYKRFSAAGIRVFANERNRKYVLEGISEALIKRAELKELPEFFGWNKMSNGTWHFAKKDELTMVEVRMYARDQ